MPYCDEKGPDTHLSTAADKPKNCLFQSPLKCLPFVIHDPLRQSEEIFPLVLGKPSVGFIPLIPEGFAILDSGRNHGLNGQQGLEERCEGYLPQGRRAANHLPDPPLLFNIIHEVLKKGHLAETKSYCGKPLDYLPIFDSHGQQVDELLQEG